MFMLVCVVGDCVVVDDDVGCVVVCVWWDLVVLVWVWVFSNVD